MDSFTPEEREEINKVVAEDLKKYDAYLEEWAAALRAHIRDKRPTKVKKRPKPRHPRRK